MKTLYVTDLDGTLLRSDTRLSAYTVETINAMVAKGMFFTYATARSEQSAQRVCQGLDMRIPVIVYNGARIVRPEDGGVLLSLSFDAQMRQHTAAYLSGLDIDPLVYAFVDGVQRVSWLEGRENEGIRYYLSQRAGDPRLRPVRSRRQLYAGDVFYCTCVGDKTQLEPVYAHFHADARFTCLMQQELYRREYWCELMPRDATKANAVLKLKQLLGCGRVVSFGDAVNDLAMFDVSDECYAVANAVDVLKARARAVIDSNDRDGVARYLAGRILAKPDEKTFGSRRDQP